MPRFLAMAFAVLLLTDPAAAQNLVQNGTFNANLAGWTAKGVTAEWDTADAHDAQTSGSARVYPPVARECTDVPRVFSETGGSLESRLPLGIYQTVPIPLYSGNIYLLDAIMRRNSDGQGFRRARVWACVTGGQDTVCESYLELTYGTADDAWGAQRYYSNARINTPPWAENVTIVLDACTEWFDPVSINFDDVSLRVEAPSACSISCVASAPSNAPAGTAVQFQGSGSPANCTGAVSFAWTFGDGQTSATANTSHTYTASGTYSWVFQATAGGRTCTKTGTIRISDGPARIRGRVTAGGAALNGSLLRPGSVVQLVSQGRVVADSPIGPDGRYSLEASAGTYAVEATVNYTDYRRVERDSPGTTEDVAIPRTARTSVAANVTGGSEMTVDLGLPNPILFVHGILSHGDKWDSWIAALPSDRMAFSPDYHNVSRGLGAIDLVERSIVDQLLLSTRVLGPRVGLDVVAHSRGGLASRALVNDYRDAWQFGRIVLLGTPNNGSACATFKGIDLTPFGGLSRCGIEEFNRTYPTFPVETMVVAGAVYRSGCMLSAVDPDLARERSLGDGWVAVDSAFKITHIENGTPKSTLLPGIIVNYKHEDLGSSETLYLLDSVVLPFLRSGSGTVPPCTGRYATDDVNCGQQRPSPANCGRYVPTGERTGQCNTNAGTVTTAVTVSEPSPGGERPSAVSTASATGPCSAPSSVAAAGLLSARPIASTAFGALLGYDIYASLKAFSRPEQAVAVGFLPLNERTFFHTAPDADRMYYGALAVYEQGKSALTLAPPPTAASAVSMLGGRFRVSVVYRNQFTNPPAEGVLTGRSLSSSAASETAIFSFDDPTVVEFMVRLSDARPFDNHIHVFYGGLSDVEFSITITDTKTGKSMTYWKGPNLITGATDRTTFVADPAQAGPTESSDTPTDAAPHLENATSTLRLLNGRFEVRVFYRNQFASPVATGYLLGQTIANSAATETAVFFFDNPQSVEWMVRFSDARPFDEHVHFFHGGLTDVELRIEVYDTRTGMRREYSKAPNLLTGGVDRTSFATGGLSCSTVTVSKSAFSVPASGATVRFRITTSDQNCQWTIGPPVNWINVKSGAQGTGSADVTLVVDKNEGIVICPGGPSTPREHAFQIVDKTVTVRQAAP